MRIRRHLEELSLRELSQRREALGKVLLSEGIKFSCEGSGSITNFMFASEGDPSGSLFSAHYDNYRGSCGANDNMASVCILVDLCHALTAEKIRADFLLTDGEEDSYAGAELFTTTYELKQYSGIINLDLCGYGDSIVIQGRLPSFTARSLLKKHDAVIVKYLPESDDVVFRKYHVPTLSVSIVPKWDVQYLKALASFSEGILGRPPEFFMILSQMEITQTFHNGSKDSPEFVDELAMQKIHDYLLDAVMSRETTAKFSLKNLFKRCST